MDSLRAKWRRTMSLLTDSLLSSSRQCRICHGSISPKKLSQDLPRPTLQHVLCIRCLTVIPWIGSVQCEICGRPEHCPDCLQRSSLPLQLNRSAVQYNEQMKEWLAAYKYRGHERMLDIMAEMLELAYAQLVGAIVSLHGERRSAQASFRPLVTSVPIHPVRLQERGFNQAEQLAVRLANKHRLNYFPTLRRVRHTRRQSMKSRRERLADLQGAFVWDDQFREQLLNAGVLHHCNAVIIVDDVYTTGSTLHECASVLQEHVPFPVYGITWAR